MQLLTGKYFRIFLFSVSCLTVSVLAQTKFPYEKADIPFNAKPVERTIDKNCSDRGLVKKTLKSFAAQEAQNQAKNNFGVKGTPVPIQIADFDRLEKVSLQARNCWFKKLTGCRKLELTGGLPINRQQLVDITTTENGDEVGEGTLVVLEAKVLDSHYSNTKYNIYGKDRNGNPEVGSGESVNCKNLEGVDSSGIDRNDIHIVLAMPGEKRSCYSVTAEISPHFRPDSWRRFHDMEGNINAEANGVDFKKIQLVRIAGPLFYDASHEPCSPGKPSSPARRSIWEIHPAYQLYQVKSSLTY